MQLCIEMFHALFETRIRVINMGDDVFVLCFVTLSPFEIMGQHMD